MSDDSVVISTSTCLQDYFHQSVSDVLDRHGVEGESDTVWYLTQLLCTYSRSSRFFDQQVDGGTLTPLAEYYRHAVEAASDQERRLHLQRLGDVAIFISSLFAGALERRAVDVDYYIAMGESAYGALADGGVRSARDRALVSIFDDLAQQFPVYVEALSDIPARQDDPRSLLQLVDAWTQSKDPALARQLRERGVFLEDVSDTPVH